jgi:Tfp pilus assembly protein PilP
MRFVKTLILGILLTAAAAGLHAQAKPASGPGTNPATAAAAKPAPQSAKPADKPVTKPVAQAPAKPAAAPASAQNKPGAPGANKAAPSGGKPAASTTNAKSSGPAANPVAPAAKPAQKPAQKHSAKKSAPKSTKPEASAAPSASTADKETKVAKRDPFESLVGREQSVGKIGPLPAGKAGLQVNTLRLDGIVRAPNGMIAVVSNPQSRTYFLREGDQLYDGRVEKIAMDGVSFHEIGKDAFGKPVERQVNKRIYASAGEQQ